MSEGENGWGGHRHGRKRQSTIQVVQLHVAVKQETRAFLGTKADEKGVTLGELIDEIVKNREQTEK